MNDWLQRCSMHTFEKFPCSELSNLSGTRGTGIPWANKGLVFQGIWPPQLHNMTHTQSHFITKRTRNLNRLEAEQRRGCAGSEAAHNRSSYKAWTPRYTYGVTDCKDQKNTSSGLYPIKTDIAHILRLCSTCTVSVTHHTHCDKKLLLSFIIVIKNTVSLYFA